MHFKINQQLILKIAILVFLMAISHAVLSSTVSRLPIFTNSIESLEDSKEAVMKVTGAAIGLSALITFLPDDFATPLADTLADMSTYFVVLLGTILFEKLIIVYGIPLTFKFIVPVSLCLFIVFLITHKKFIKTLAIRILALSIVIIFAVPIGTAISRHICSDMMAYVDETVTMAEDGSSKVEEISESSSSDKSFYDKVSDIFSSAIEGVSDLFNYYKGILLKFINSIVIMMVAYLVIPVITFIVMLWMINQLFQFNSFRDNSDEIGKIVGKAIDQNKEKNEEENK